MKKIIAVSIIISMLLFMSTITFCQKTKWSFLTPFMRSLFFNQNVYKTQDSLDVVKVYYKNKNKRLPITDSTIYRIMPYKNKQDSLGNFIRYIVLNAGSGHYIQILKATKFSTTFTKYDTNLVKTDTCKDSIKNIDSVKYTYIIFDSTEKGPHSFYYKILGKDPVPSQKYLATEHITGLPITIPIKYRKQATSNQSPVSLNASIGYAFGYKIRANNNPFKENYFRLLVVTGIGTDSYIPKDSISSKGYKAPTETIWTYAIGVTYEVNNKFNIGLFWGADKMFGMKKDWFYQAKSWIGLGFGYKF